MASVGSCSAGEFATALTILGNNEADANSVCTSYDVQALTLSGAILAQQLGNLVSKRSLARAHFRTGALTWTPCSL
jgi:hypothetical protein